MEDYLLLEAEEGHLAPRVGWVVLLRSVENVSLFLSLILHSILCYN